ncbi:MAG: glycoside hydrolase family 5 protein [Oscillospiraceae bacterium]|jgi:endoglucanase|nr:glycoside hydrolase family 5 protein [Oscillospiraceae bacterium]
MKIKKIVKSTVLILFLIVAAAIAVQCTTQPTIEDPPLDNESNNGSSDTENNTNTEPPDDPDDNVVYPESDIAHLTSMELTHIMTAGWNLGNTLDAHWNARPWGTINLPSEQEMLWGNPKTTKEMIDKIKETGFNTVRIPVTWYIFTDPGPDYIIDDIWMDRVQEVVDYVINNDMFCILNMHHEDYKSGSNWQVGWLRLYNSEENRPLTDEEKDEKKLRFARSWEQISERFSEYDEYLIFEGINEPRTEGLGSVSREMWAEQSEFLNELLQVFVDTVRASGGRNPDRHLMITPYFASVGMNRNDSEGRIAGFVDTEAGKLRVNDPRNRLIASLHYYEPWGFVTAPADSTWHSWYFDLDVGSVSHNIENVFAIFEENFISHGIPVIMGETGAISRTMPDGESNEAERVKWAEYFITKLKEMGVPTVIWDDGGNFQLLDRENLEWIYPDLVNALVVAGNTPVR